MKIKSKIYAEALVDLILKPGTDEHAAENFLELLLKNGDMGKLKEIVSLAEEIFIKKTGRRKIIIESARKIKAKNKEIIQSIAHQGDIITERINSNLIAGIKIIINDEQLDLSMQKKLQNIFK